MSKYAGMNGSFAENIRQFAEQAKSGIDATFREIVIEIGSSVIRMSPVGNPEIWAANVAHRQANTRAADDYDFKVSVRNTVINLTDSNFTKAGKLKRGVKYAKPLTKTEREQNFNVNGLVAGKGYIGGRFRGNWQFSIDTPAEGVLDQVDPSGNVTIAVLRAQVQALTIGQTAYIVNNLPYGIALEYGHSKQAPGGMVRVTLTRFQQIVEEAIRNNQV
ncbi:hypothetical protein C1Y08_20575 [Pseudomonas sp. FW306-02-F02-AA]|uniref:Prophage PssSM-02 n=1 Tax=Pseudomonas fluorescens TaxID=294 RepID=A0A0N9WM39_PSEFL|nr:MULTISPECIES: hypothetical protein [Pseudomonas]ALI04387.1 hypothetical protein AO353_26215 [Pseudomonas fluorescens]PMZ03864.1 hypothetical protein C1Y07_11670 [Pseudomonas sp. FW306-02-F02-AB]PMZ08229.1 hypothetical protein C1Y06_20010 [Pseudomonas sp. FW306-02-H06C]PMZ13969.1 hypothetical protein C1Y08_20575 [Pseudomonas sp. FW306-02-F02-AA]PMZ21522.1 hypothetical protein C1Y09_13880 [Pseudomonas sp. FW306-02-F08-AA]